MRRGMFEGGGEGGIIMHWVRGILVVRCAITIYSTKK